jgi:LmbE family N-acetylglucosaminyl deacetylase/GT2 family glycosyltransferase
VLIEAEAIPYEPALLRGERLLVLAPHPDDEVIGCGGLVAQHLHDRRAVRVVVATDGAQAGSAATREEESRRALDRLGEGVQLEFLRFPDRALGDEARLRLREELLAFRPDLIAVPSPIEIHPDHLSLSRIFCELVQRDETLFADLAVARVAFYEVGQPIRPNAIVDITDVAEAKYAAISEHTTQTKHRDYVSYARGLNAYRAMTMPPATQYAEAYLVVDLPSLRTTPFSELRRRAGTPPEIAITHEVAPVSVVIRTKDRPSLLREAIDSVRKTGYPAEIVVVNDGGARPDVEGVLLVEHETSRGRAEAANAGVRAAAHPLLAFLDDDDLFYPEHLQTLTTAAGTAHAAWYSDAVSAFLRPGAGGAYEVHSRMRLFAQDYDRELLLIDNYIPLPALLFRRETFLDLGGFDPRFDLFEDWDLLIRLSRRGDFLRVPRVTCEIRHFEGGSSVVLAAPVGSERYRAAKLAVWEKHAELLGNAVFANVFEQQKKRAGTLYSQLVESRGEVDDVHRDVARLTREKDALIAQNAAAQDTLNGYALRHRELEGAVAVMSGIVGDYENKTVQMERLSRQLEELQRLNVEANGTIRDAHGEIERLRVEIARLSGLLEIIYRSRTWKLHTTLEKIRGRG